MLPGDTIQNNRYELRSVIGQGGMATVFRAWDRVLQVERAIKVMKPEVSAHASLRRRLLKEARIMARLKDPGVVDIIDIGTEDGQIFLVLELLEGGSLADRLESEKSLPMEEAVEVTRQLLRTLQKAHDAGVIHRDIKPDNLLLAGDRTKVADFGIARDRDSNTRLTRTGATMGTLAYMSPEQYTDAADVDARTDLYAAGVSLLEMVTGRLIMGMHSMRPTDPRLEAVPAPILAVIVKATRFNPEDRYDSAAAMLAALDAAEQQLHEKPRPVWVMALGGCMVSLLGLGALAAVGVVGVVLSDGMGEAEEPAAEPVVEEPAVADDVPEEPEEAPPEEPPEEEAPEEAPPAAPTVRQQPPERVTPPVVEEVPEDEAEEPPAEEAPPEEPQEPGTVRINSRPASTAYLNGSRLGPSFQKYTIPAGRQRIELRLPDGTSHQEALSVESGGQQTLCWDFESNSYCSR